MILSPIFIYNKELEIIPTIGIVDEINSSYVIVYGISSSIVDAFDANESINIQNNFVVVDIVIENNSSIEIYENQSITRVEEISESTLLYYGEQTGIEDAFDTNESIGVSSQPLINTVNEICEINPILFGFIGSIDDASDNNYPIDVSYEESVIDIVVNNEETISLQQPSIVALISDEYSESINLQTDSYVISPVVEFSHITDMTYTITGSFDESVESDTSLSLILQNKIGIVIDVESTNPLEIQQTLPIVEEIDRQMMVSSAQTSGGFLEAVESETITDLVQFNEIEIQSLNETVIELYLDFPAIENSVSLEQALNIFTVDNVDISTDEESSLTVTTVPFIKIVKCVERQIKVPSPAYALVVEEIDTSNQINTIQQFIECQKDITRSIDLFDMNDAFAQIVQENEKSMIIPVVDSIDTVDNSEYGINIQIVDEIVTASESVEQVLDVYSVDVYISLVNEKTESFDVYTADNVGIINESDEQIDVVRPYFIVGVQDIDSHIDVETFDVVEVCEEIDSTTIVKDYIYYDLKLNVLYKDLHLTLKKDGIIIGKL